MSRHPPIQPASCETHCFGPEGPGFAALLARYAASGEKLGPTSSNTPVIKGDA